MTTLIILGHMLLVIGSADMLKDCGTLRAAGCQHDDVIIFDTGQPLKGQEYTIKHEAAHWFCQRTKVRDTVHLGIWPVGFEQAWEARR